VEIHSAQLPEPVQTNRATSLGAARLFCDNAPAKRRIVVAFQRYGAAIARQAGLGSGRSITTLDMSCRTAEWLA